MVSGLCLLAIECSSHVVWLQLGNPLVVGLVGDQWYFCHPYLHTLHLPLLQGTGVGVEASFSLRGQGVRMALGAVWMDYLIRLCLGPGQPGLVKRQPARQQASTCA